MHYMHARVGRCMRATKEKWNNDVSFNASVAIFYLRITRDNGRLAYEYVPRPWYRITHACARTHTHTRALARKTHFTSTMVPVQTCLCTARTRAGNTRIYVTHRLLFILQQFPSVTMPSWCASGCRTISTGVTTGQERGGKRGGKTGSVHHMYIIYRPGQVLEAIFTRHAWTQYLIAPLSKRRSCSVRWPTYFSPKTPILSSAWFLYKVNWRSIGWSVSRILYVFYNTYSSTHTQHSYNILNIK